MEDLFGAQPGPPASSRRRSSKTYSAEDIEVLEGLEPVRRRPGMYIGGTDATALHHLAAEIFDNAMDEAVAGYADRIEVRLEADNVLAIRDNGRGIPVDPHPKFPGRSALEVILTTLHAGGKFSSKAYATAGGLHGVGSSVVNALSERLEVEVRRDGALWRQVYARGKPLGPLEKAAEGVRGQGTLIRFRPDPEIFGSLRFDPARLFRLCRSKAYLYRGVRILWSADAAVVAGTDVPEAAEFHFPGGLRESLEAELGAESDLLGEIWWGEAPLPPLRPGLPGGRIEWAMGWREWGEPFLHSYCNTIPTPEGGTHEAGLRAALLKGIRAYGESRGVKRAREITAEDIASALAGKLSLFIADPQFQGQTKEKLTTPEAARLVENALRDHFDHYLGADPARADALLTHLITRAEERLRRRQAREVARKTPTRRLRLPGKLADCTSENTEETELFLVEGDSAGGSAKQARNRETQAVLPLRGKILNVASASSEKLQQNQELKDLVEALGCGVGRHFDLDRLRYGRIIIMTDADVDGAHIASLLMTFFYRELPGLIEAGRLYLAQPPLYRLAQGSLIRYAMTDRERDHLLATVFKGSAKVEISRFKGLGEMPPAILRQTTMDPRQRTLLRVIVPETAREETAGLVEQLMGRRAELRFRFIQERAPQIEEIDL
jgi:topoisomerase-4 subunit B